MGRIGDFFYHLIIVILVAAALVFLLMAFKEQYPIWKNQQELENLRSKVEKKKTKNENPHINWENLKSTNPEIVGWIKVPGTKIDYPILQGKEWNEYLHKNYKGDYSYAGSIFIQPEAAFNDQHLIIYGHNMRVKSMFGSLHDFESEDFYKKHNKIYLYQPGKTIKCTIYSVYDCLDKSATYNTDFSDDGNDNKWVDWLTMTVNNNAYYPIKKKPAEKDHSVETFCLSYQMALPLFVRSSICNIKSRCTFRDAAAYTSKYSICTDSNALSPSKQSIWTWIWLYSRNHVFAFYLCAAFRSGEKQIYQTR